MCHNRKLVQLDQDFLIQNIYTEKIYGYRTGINYYDKTCSTCGKRSSHKIAKIKKGEYVLDIASNDGTLLNFYGRNVITVGIDPILKSSKFYKKIIGPKFF